MKKRIAAILVAIMCAALLAACSGGNKDQANAKDESWEYIEGKKQFIMGLDDSFPPMGFRENNEIVGFDVDLAKEVAKRLEVELKLQPIDWKTRELELNGKNVDVIWNGFSKTPEREATMTLSKPYMTNVQSIMVKKDSSIKKLEDLKDKKVAVQDGSSAQAALKNTFANNQDLYDSIKQLNFKENMTALMDLENGNVDALAIDSVVAQYMMNKTPGKYVLLQETLSPEDYVIGFRKGDVAFKEKVDQAIADMKADGKFAEISTKWFGKDISAGNDTATTTAAGSTTAETTTTAK